jgi:hypothetical protein
VPLQLSWDDDAAAGYLPLREIRAGQAVHQRVVANPVAGVGDVVLDFDAEGHLLGIEFLDERIVPPGLPRR